MPDVLGSPPSPRAALFWNGTQWQWARVAATGHLRIDVMGSALPAGAATAANQALILAQVQAIEDLTHALQSVATDRLKVRGEDQLFSYKEALLDSTFGAVSGAGGYWQSTVVPAGEIWKVTNIRAVDDTSPTTSHLYSVRRAAADHWFEMITQAFAALGESWYHGHVWLDAGDAVRVYFVGGLVGDTCRLNLTGFRMTVE